jgi:MATE family multidrug resistance protein
MVFYGGFLGMQNSFYPMVIAVTVNLVNVGASFLFVRVFHMEVSGVALGSVVGQYVGLILAVLLFSHQYSWVWRLFTVKLSLIRNGLSRFLNVGRDIFVRTLCVISVFTFFTSRSAGMGDDILAANSALLQFLFLFSYFLDGFAYAAEAMVGKWFGSNDKQSLNKAVKNLLVWGGSLGLLFSLAYGLAGSRLLAFFTDQEAVVEIGREYLIWLITMPLVSFASYIWDGIYIGATASKAMRNSMLIAAGGFFFLPFYLLFPYFQNHALWIGMWLFMLSRSVLLSWLYPRL